MVKPSWIGATLKGRYRIDELLGQGGMSAVYKATDPNLKRVVAIKLIHPHLADNAQFVTRFEEEAASVAKLRHNNIVQVYDFDHDGDTYYMVLEFVAGESLNDRLKRLTQSKRHLPVADALQILSQVCDAVDYAHKRGLVHRDIKPANIMLDVQGHAILMDFGIVKIVGGEKHTATGAVLGTALYMSPEQIKGEAAEPRSDIYSLGVTLFEMLSGKPPFQADSVMTILMMHLTDAVPDLKDLRSDIPASVLTIIHKAMAKSAADRYQTAAEMAQALREALGRLETRQLQAAPEDVVSTVIDEGSTVIDDPGAVQKVKTPADKPEPIATIIERSVEPEKAPPPIRPSVPKPEARAADKTGEDTGPMPVIRTPKPAGQSGPYNAVISAQPGNQTSGGAPTGPSKPGPSDSQPLRRPEAAASPGGKKTLWGLIAAGGAGALILIAILVTVVVLAIRQFGGLLGKDVTGQASLNAQASQTAAAVIAGQIETVLPTKTETAPPPTPTPQPSATATPTIALTPTNTPLPTETPTPTVPPGIQYVRINRITLNEQSKYVVEYQTFEYTEVLPGTHIHFFFNTVPPEKAGYPAGGPWFLWGGPRPFDGYGVNDKPSSATQMCALVANPNHSIQPGSGNCVNLP